jgi:DNA repair photolyase
MTDTLVQAWPQLQPVGRRGPVLRASTTQPSVYGVDLTAGCGHGCTFCHIRTQARYPGDDRLPFDPYTTEALAAALDEHGDEVRTIVLSPSSDPLPPIGPVRAEAVRVAEKVLESGRELVLMTRGRLPRRLVALLSEHPDRARVALGMMSLNKGIVRALEPRAASPRGRIRDLERLTRSGVTVEIRLEPLLPGLTDTRDNLAPLFHALARAGASRVVAHYMFMHRAIWPSLQRSLEPLGVVDAVRAAFEDGPLLTVGSVGTVRNVGRDARREGLARIMAWGAEFGLDVTTGATQNPDLPRTGPPRGPRPAAGPPEPLAPLPPPTMVAVA